MYRRLGGTVLVIAAALSLTAGQAGADPITTSSYTTWKSYLTGAPTELDFYPVIASKDYNTAAGVTLTPSGKTSPAFVFTGPDNGSYSLSQYYYGSIASIAGASDGTGKIQITTPATGSNALLLGLGTTGGTPITATLSDGESFTAASGLFGFALGHTITSVTLSTTAGSQLFVDDFFYGTSNVPADSPTPPATGGGNQTDPTPAAEGSSLVLLGGGLLVLIGTQRKLLARIAA